MNDNRFWETPQPPQYTPIEPWEELPDDTRYPATEGDVRYGIERHWHRFWNGAADEWQDVSATAVFVTNSGETIEFGPWSLDSTQARILAHSLTALAEAAEPERSNPLSD